MYELHAIKLLLMVFKFKIPTNFLKSMSFMFVGKIVNSDTIIRMCMCKCLYINWSSQLIHITETKNLKLYIKSKFFEMSTNASECQEFCKFPWAKNFWEIKFRGKSASICLPRLQYRSGETFWKCNWDWNLQIKLNMILFFIFQSEHLKCTELKQC